MIAGLTALAWPNLGRCEERTSKAAGLALGARLQGPKRLLAHENAAIFVLSAKTGSAPTLSASAGRFEAASRRDDGNWQAVYHPPSPRTPRAVVVVARDETGALLAWTSVRVWGAPKVSVDTEPHAEVTVRVSGSDFGPVKADGAGHAKLEVRVPPGRLRATVSARDALGNLRKRPLNLRIAPVRPVMAVCPTVLDDRLWVFALKASGQADARSRFRAEASDGGLSKLRRVARGAWTARFTPDASSKATVSPVVVKSAKSQKVLARCDAPLPGRPPEAVSLVAVNQEGQEVTTAQAGTSLRLQVRVHYPAEGWAIADSPHVEASTGEVGEADAVGETDFEVTWQVPKRLSEDRQAEVSVLLESSGLEVTEVFELQAGPTEQLEAVPPTLEATRGADAVELRVFARDAFGNRVRQVALSAQAQGRISKFRVSDTGALLADYTPPKEGRARIDRIEVRDTLTGTTLRVPVKVTPRTGAMRISARAGVSHNFGLLTTPVSLVRLQTRLPILQGQLFAGIQTGWFGGSAVRADADDTEDVTASVTAMPALTLAGYSIPLGPLELVAGAQAGVVFARTMVESTSSGREQRLTTPIALGGFLGAELPLGPGHLAAESAWLHAPAAGSVSGNLAGLQVTAGYGVDL